MTNTGCLCDKCDLRFKCYTEREKTVSLSLSGTTNIEELEKEYNNYQQAREVQLRLEADANIEWGNYLERIYAVKDIVDKPITTKKLFSKAKTVCPKCDNKVTEHRGKFNVRHAGWTMDYIFAHYGCKCGWEYVYKPNR